MTSVQRGALALAIGFVYLGLGIVASGFRRAWTLAETWQDRAEIMIVAGLVGLGFAGGAATCFLLAGGFQ